MDLKKLGAGYPMYFTFIKNMALVFWIISILISLPCIIIVVVSLLKSPDYSETDSSYISLLSVGPVVLHNLSSLSDSFDSVLQNSVLCANIIIYFNMAGILILLVY